MLNYYYKDDIDAFIKRAPDEIVGRILTSNQFDTKRTETKAWIVQIEILKKALTGLAGTVLFEFSIPRMGKRVDALIIVNGVVFVVEFKVGEKEFHTHHVTQVWDYGLDLKNFHRPSHDAILAPVLVATEALNSLQEILITSHNDGLLLPLKTNGNELGSLILKVLEKYNDKATINGADYVGGSYAPTPTIVEAAISLYNSHSVENITRNDANAKNLTSTTDSISSIIDAAKKTRTKRICFVTGVPGAGKTLVGLKVATSHLDNEKGSKSVYLSGNAPLVAVLQEALAIDQVQRSRQLGRKLPKSRARDSVRAFIQIIHHYRDAYLVDSKPPYDHVAIFDEAQRAWTKAQTADFMRQKKGLANFGFSEPEFLISCLDRHKDWAVVICLVGGGQEINTGEAGISEWIYAIKEKFSDWEVHVSPNLTDSEYSAAGALKNLQANHKIHFDADLHLAVSMRSFRAELLSLFIKQLLDRDVVCGRETLHKISGKYPIVLTRDLQKAKDWLQEKARGSERYGLVASSKALRLKPLAINVKPKIDPVSWFLNESDDVRSSYFLEDPATEFDIQGLELDWVCLTWDGDLRFHKDEWKTFAFVGNKWQKIKQPERKNYLTNAYRVLLTRARQGIVIVVPEGNLRDHTRMPEFYDGTYNYLKGLGLTNL